MKSKEVFNNEMSFKDLFTGQCFRLLQKWMCLVVEGRCKKSI